MLLLVVQFHEVLNQEAQRSNRTGRDLLLVTRLERGVLNASCYEGLHFVRCQAPCLFRIDDDLLNRIETADETQCP